MILTSGESGDIEVAELRDDAKGVALLAKASGKVAVGDTVLAIGDKLLSRNGPPSLEFAASEFKAAARPVRVLFEKKR